MKYDRDLLVRRIDELERTVEKRRQMIDQTIGALVEVRTMLEYFDRLEAAALTVASVDTPVEAAPIEAKE